MWEKGKETVQTMKFIHWKKQQLLMIFVLALAISVAWGTILPVFTQKLPAPNPCNQLRGDIQNRAKKDAEADRLNFFNTDKKKKTIGDILNLYKEVNSQASCFPQDELWDIYEQQYDINKYPDWIPWPFIVVVSFILVVLVAFIGDTLKKWLNQSLDAISKWIYKTFAGTPLFENIALKKYRQALIDKYQKLNIPFRPHRPLEMREIYVSLKAFKASDRSLIEAENAVQKYRRLVVKGAPGSGKSMLLKYLALSYSEGRFKNLSDRPVPILLELNRLNDANLTVEKLEQHLVEACDRHNFPKANRFISQGLKDGRLLLLLDGLDEVSSGIRSSVVRCLKDFLELEKYKKCRVIITCRTAVYHNEFVDNTEETLEIDEFSDQQMRRFLQAWKSEMPPEKSVEQLIQNLRARPKIMALARNPLLLTIIAYLYTDIPFVLPHSRAEFYTQATNVLLELRDQERNISNQYTGVNKRRVLQHLALYAQDSAKRQQQDRRSLLDSEVWEQVKQVLPSLNLEPKEANSIVDEIVKRSGLLLRIDGGQRYYFPHLTLQEYFVAAALTDKQAELIQKWQNAPSDWLEIVKLWCGLANNSTDLITAVYQQDALTAFECLADAQEVKPEVAQEIIDYFKTQLRTDESICSAFGSVAADFRPRGKALFDFLVASLDNSASQKAAAQALSATNLPQAVEKLVIYYDPNQPHFIEVREALIRMGGLAVNQLESLARKGSIEAMDDLVKIAIPEAAEALERLQEDPNLRGKVSFRLAALLKQLEDSQAERNRTLS
ncbi:MAG: NACHT domain-containing protein [Microcystis aeruginosa Ma_MB_F_20061100_S19]|uniref:Putative NTPase (NACHT family) n=1 Tax=Microcystis aeruginosa SPC777 TaxID=482300 RepID=S3J0Z5_MICAE|nr:NACHT domain-containing protein [Microcystis aeruginosa]NCR97387.1 NACHT domain-containing protein [Microcystis aeruginosa L311-01]OCY12854.1 MAG: NACHT domain protein [Microcystis aeruginosa CACIAM 03]TRU06086.1 MAG: NACHT domain-containing protein [Microcystis aeruginosa Ma_MB_F_20061100_S19D]TRU15986.1 MAG: NACHT domain-containing protein [Microcystis aeruginosa Ma_MB_F_20061100_S19]EPF18860.1 putative NTPase (NACHT family) [Microcystis aeruginosa SPC777]